MAEEVQDEAVEDILSLRDISFKGRTLAEWDRELTVRMPALPTTTLEISGTVASLNDKYQLAYNCYNELMVLTADAERQYKRVVNAAIQVKVDELQEAGMKKMPARDTLETLCSEATGVTIAKDRLELYELIKEFFENNKIKLEKSMQLVLNVSFNVHHSDKMHFSSGAPRL